MDACYAIHSAITFGSNPSGNKHASANPMYAMKKVVTLHVLIISRYAE